MNIHFKWFLFALFTTKTCFILFLCSPFSIPCILIFLLLKHAYFMSVNMHTSISIFTKSITGKFYSKTNKQKRIIVLSRTLYLGKWQFSQRNFLVNIQEVSEEKENRKTQFKHVHLYFFLTKNQFIEKRNFSYVRVNIFTV